MAQSIFDKVAFEILSKLFENREGMRFKDFKKALSVSDPVISNRLSLLKVHGLVQVSPVIEDENERYFVYRITPDGIAFADRINISNLMESVAQIERARRSKRA